MPLNVTFTAVSIKVEDTATDEATHLLFAQIVKVGYVFLHGIPNANQFPSTRRKEQTTVNLHMSDGSVFHIPLGSQETTGSNLNVANQSGWTNDRDGGLQAVEDIITAMTPA